MTSQHVINQLEPRLCHSALMQIIKDTGKMKPDSRPSFPPRNAYIEVRQNGACEVDCPCSAYLPGFQSLSGIIGGVSYRGHASDDE